MQMGQMLCLAVQEGKLVLYYDFTGEVQMAPPFKDPDTLAISSNTNKGIHIFLFKRANKDLILVRLEQSTIFTLEHENTLQNATSYYLGGVPVSILPESLKKKFPKGGSIRGCMKGLKAHGKYVDLKRMNTTGVSYGCTSDLLVARSVKLHGHGFLTLSLPNVPSLQDFYTGFSFHTSQSQGLMYHHATGPRKPDKPSKPSKPSSAPSDRSKSKPAKGPKRPSESKSTSPTPKRPKQLGSASTPASTPTRIPRPRSESSAPPSDDRSQPLTTPEDHQAQVVTVPSRSPSVYSRPPSDILDREESLADTRRDRQDWLPDVESDRRPRYSRSRSRSYRDDYLLLSRGHRYRRYSPDSRSPSPYTYARRYFASRDRPDSRLMSPYPRTREPDRRDRRSPRREELPPRPLQPPSAALGAPPSDPATRHVDPPLYMPDLSKPTESSADSDDHGSEASDSDPDASEGVCQVSLKNGRVAVNVLTTELTTKNAYADDTSHYVAIYSDSAGVRVYIDDQLQGTQPGADRHRRQKPLEERALFHLGGMPQLSEMGNLSGCIGNVFVRRKLDPQVVVDLQQSTESVNVTMNCPRDRQPQQMRAPEKKDKWKPKVVSTAVLKDETCQLPKHPKAIKGSFQFGGSSVSRLEFDDVPATFQERFHFSMEVRLNSSNGLLFYMASESQDSFFSLFVSGGRLVLLANFDGNKLRLRSKDKFRDGKWHTVFFSRDRSKVQLTVDGLRAQGKSLPTAGDFRTSGPFYVGGAPVEKAKAHIPDASATSFNGCLRHLKLDRKPLDSPSRVFGVTPCYVGTLESGIFFSTEGGYITLDGYVTIGQDFELMLEIRPRSTSGLIFHIGARPTNYLRLYTDSQQVTVVANTGAGEFSASVARPSLCDGQWHTIAVIKSSSVIQVDVDTEGNYTVGPNQVLPTAVKEDFYLGGMPEAATHGGLTSPAPPVLPYVGCMKNLVINRNQINLPQAGAIRGAVGLRGCPVM
ncbi:UNVERIFIED_CONTAM: hypothetical protein K2H54_069335 [Gekko kuhli]